MKVLVNLLWLVPGVVGGSEDSVTDALRAVAALDEPDLDLRLAVLSSFPAAHPDLSARFPCEVSELDGIGKTMPITMTAFLVASLSIIGMPPLGGAWSKWYLALGSLEAGYAFLIAVMMLSSLLNVAYLLSIVGRAFFVPAACDDRGAHAGEGIREDAEMPFERCRGIDVDGRADPVRECGEADILGMKDAVTIGEVVHGGPAGSLHEGIEEELFLRRVGIDRLVGLLGDHPVGPQAGKIGAGLCGGGRSCD